MNMQNKPQSKAGSVIQNPKNLSTRAEKNQKSNGKIRMQVKYYVGEQYVAIKTLLNKYTNEKKRISRNS